MIRIRLTQRLPEILFQLKSQLIGVDKREKVESIYIYLTNKISNNNINFYCKLNERI